MPCRLNMAAVPESISRRGAILIFPFCRDTIIVIDTPICSVEKNVFPEPPVRMFHTPLAYYSSSVLGSIPILILILSFLFSFSNTLTRAESGGVLCVAHFADGGHVL